VAFKLQIESYATFWALLSGHLSSHLSNCTKTQHFVSILSSNDGSRSSL